MKSRITYIECKAISMTGEARIGRVISKSGRTLYYGDQELRHLPCPGRDNSNHYDVATGEDYWVSGPKKDGGDRRHSARVPVHVDADVREEYWTSIRSLPHRAADEDASH